MSPARNAAQARTVRQPASGRRAGRPAPRPRRVQRTGARIRIRWDRAGRIGMLVVLSVVAGLYVQHALALLSTHNQAQQQLATVERLARENAALIKQSQSLNDTRTIVRDARALGMVRPGEHPYVITGMPQH